MKTDALLLDGASIYSSYQQATIPREDGLTVAIFHGAGQSTSERFVDIGQFFLAKGVSVVALDFIGHGKTGGNLHSNSLELRTKHALAAIDHWTDPKTPLILLGSSMGGHTALRVSELLGGRIEALCLLQPAVYASDAESVFFTEDFTAILRQPESWRSSYALENARTFTGRAYIAIGSMDTVIPWGVIEELIARFRQNASAFRLEIMHGAAHTLPEWIPSHSFHASQMVDFLLYENKKD
ncbi:MAG TPA: alpha/beta fold hydrolase [Candidatus Saccharimonadia bacterium]|nr:alpha/beta fold hydrolase [Candidatus Saccharimonadia bacterium]